MIELRAAADLGRTEHDWLRARHHFCFAGYQASDRLAWGGLRVLNQSILAPHAVLKPSFHSDIEIVLLVEQGVIECTRSDGTSARIGAGAAMAIYAGIGIELALSNPFATPAHFTTIWLTCEPSVERAVFRPPAFIDPDDVMIASGFEGDRASLRLKTPARLTRHALAQGTSRELAISTSMAYLLGLSGSMDASGVTIREDDGLAIDDEQSLTLRAPIDASILLVEA